MLSICTHDVYVYVNEFRCIVACGLNNRLYLNDMVRDRQSYSLYCCGINLTTVRLSLWS